VVHEGSPPDVTDVLTAGTIVAGVRRGWGTTRLQWLLIIAVSVGLVGMHHLLAHTAHTMPMSMAASPGSSVTRVMPAEHAHPSSNGIIPGKAASTSTSVAASQPGCCDPMDMVGHFCLAVLTASTALSTALIFVVAWRGPLVPGSLLATVSVAAARAPPTGSVRFTQLCVLRR